MLPFKERNPVMTVKNKPKMLGLNKTEPFDVVIFVLLTLFALIIFYPFYNAVLTSFVTSKQYIMNPAMLYPKTITFDNYKIILQNPLIGSGYKNTLILTVAGVAYSLTLTASMAYAFSRKAFPGKRIFFMLVLFTMFFSGGLVPIYMLMKNLGLMNSLAGLILMAGISPFYMILVKSSFEQVPDSIEEAAKIDGANDITIFLRIMLPLQLPILATITLFIAVDRWNEWFFAMLFLREGTKWPLQVLLRAIVMEAASDRDVAFSSVSQNVFSNGIKMAAVMVTMLPVMLVYPFLQKYFVKGVMVGAIKM